MRIKKRALITGITGQDGSYLSESLLSDGYEVFGLVRRTSNDPLIRLQRLRDFKKIRIIYGNLRDSASLERALLESKPDEIYNLAAQSDVGISFYCPEETVEINYYGLGRLVNAALKICPKTRIYQASTSEMFGKTPPPQKENSLFQPVSPYGEAKLKAHEDYVVEYRKRHGLYICSGFLFNHESPRRGEHFVTRKATLSLAKIACGMQKCFSVGNLDTSRDWGFAGDYVEAMRLMLRQRTPKDFVVATGKSHTIREFITAAAEKLGIFISWKGTGVQEIGKDQNNRIIVAVDKKLYRPREVNNLRGDASKALSVLGWKPKVSFDGLVEMMTQSDLENIRSSRKRK